MAIFSKPKPVDRPRIDIEFTADHVVVADGNRRSVIVPVFHLVRRWPDQPGKAPWVIVGPPGMEPTQPPMHSLNLLHPDEWPSDPRSFWTDFIGLFLYGLISDSRGRPPRGPGPDVHIVVSAPLSAEHRAAFDHKVRDIVTRTESRLVTLEWEE